MGNLVLTRRIGETILIGEDVEVEVVKIGVRNVQLMIRAPRDVLILRGEVAESEIEDELRERLDADGTKAKADD